MIGEFFKIIVIDRTFQVYPPCHNQSVVFTIAPVIVPSKKFFIFLHSFLHSL